jgi:hypothetical protein
MYIFNSIIMLLLVIIAVVLVSAAVMTGMVLTADVEVYIMTNLTTIF